MTTPNTNPAPDMAVEARLEQIAADLQVHYNNTDSFNGFRKPLKSALRAALARPQEVAGGVDLRQIAVTAALNSEGRWSYLPNTYQDAATWTPHGWVIDAMKAAIVAARPAFTGNERNNPGPGTASRAPVAVGVEPNLPSEELRKALAVLRNRWNDMKELGYKPGAGELYHDRVWGPTALKTIVDHFEEIERIVSIIPSTGAGGSVGAEPAIKPQGITEAERELWNATMGDQQGAPAPSVPLGGACDTNPLRIPLFPQERIHPGHAQDAAPVGGANEA